MSDVQSKGSKGYVFNLQQLNTDELKRIISIQQRDILSKNERLKGVENLAKICSDLEGKCKHWKSVAENTETALQRAEARIAYLNKKLGIGPQTAFGIDVINPGVSKKDFDVVTKENIQLKEALEHIVSAEIGGKDVVIKNQELYELVTTLQDDLASCNHHIKELEKMLESKGDDLASKVNSLTKVNMKLERSAQAKQIFSEKLMKENKKLQELLSRRETGRDSPDGQSDENKKSKSSVSNEGQAKLLKIIEQKEKLVSELEEKLKENQRGVENLSKELADLNVQLTKVNEREEKLKNELSEALKKSADYQKKCAGFFNQVVSLNSKQQESEEQIAMYKRTLDNLRAQIAEKDAMHQLMSDAIKTNEDDFRREREEKEAIRKRVENAQQESERLRRENQSHMATIRHFESEIERMNKLLNEKNIGRGTSNVTGFGQPFGSSSTRSLFNTIDRSPQPIVVADGMNETSTTRQGSQSSKSSPTLIECPYCSRSYPYHLIEGHVQDCMEDSLYMDD